MDKIIYAKEQDDENIILSKKEFEKIINEKNSMEKTISRLCELCKELNKSYSYICPPPPNNYHGFVTDGKNMWENK